MGGLMLVLWSLRFFAFKLYESPKYLMSRGRDQQAVDVVHKLAEYNGKTSDLTLQELVKAGTLTGKEDALLDTSTEGVIKRQLRKLNAAHVKALFSTKKLAYSTSLLIVIWGSYFSLSLVSCLADRGQFSFNWACFPLVRFGRSYMYIYRTEICLPRYNAFVPY
jgi:hypothetical protein